MIAHPSPLALATRPSLPDALRVLSERYPRPGWEAHPAFNALTRFWLDRHLMFREVQSLLVAETQGLLDRKTDPRQGARRLSRLAGLFVKELHGHHHVEDTHYFPLLRARDARLGAGFEMLDADHHALHAGLDILTDHARATLLGLGAHPADLRPTGALHADLQRFARLLDRHLTDEEDLVVPLILAHPDAGFA